MICYHTQWEQSSRCTHPTARQNGNKPGALLHAQPTAIALTAELPCSLSHPAQPLSLTTQNSVKTLIKHRRAFIHYKPAGEERSVWHMAFILAGEGGRSSEVVLLPGAWDWSSDSKSPSTRLGSSLLTRT